MSDEFVQTKSSSHNSQLRDSCSSLLAAEKMIRLISDEEKSEFFISVVKPTIHFCSVLPFNHCKKKVMDNRALLLCNPSELHWVCEDPLVLVIKKL